MCVGTPSWSDAGSGRYGAPSIRSTLSPGYGLRDISHTVQGKPRDGKNFVTDGLRPDIPDPPAPPLPPQSPKAPDIAPLKRRSGGAGFAVPAGSTLLSGPSGVTAAQMNLGTATLLGGG